ncbi:MAG: hypothetical protein PHC51_06650 [bacterium]|nr:hypothetical protein [bacterium]
MIFYLNDVAEEGLLIYVSDGAGHVDLKLYQNTNYIRNDNAAPLTNTMLAAADDGDDDIKYLVTGANIVFESAFEVFIASGTTYTPGGTVIGGAFDINGTLDAAGNNVTVSGNWDVTGGVYTSGANTTTFNGTTTLISGGTDADHDFNSVTLSGDVTLLTNAIDINGNLLINATRTLDAAGLSINLAGDWTNSGTFTHGNGLVTFDGTSNLNSGGTVAAKYFYDIVVSGSATLVTNDILLTGGLSISGSLSNVNNLNITVFNEWINTGSLESGTGTVTLMGTGEIDAGGTGIAVDDATKDFHNLIVSIGTRKLINTELEVDGTLTIAAGRTLELDGQSLDLNGTLDNSGTLDLLGTESIEVGVLDTNSGLVKYTGTASTTIPAAFTTYFNLQFDESGALDPVWTLPAVNVAVNGTLTVTDGTLNYSAVNDLQVAGAITIAATGAFTNLSGGDLTLGSTVANSGTITFDSSGGGAGDADSIQIRSTVGGTQRNWQGAGTFTMLDVDAQDQTAIGGTPAFINVSSGTDAGNNVNWTFAADAGLTLSGVAYSGKAEAGTLNSKAIRVAHYNGVTRSYYTLTTDGAGAFSLSNALLTAGDVLIFYLNDVAEEGLLTYVSDGAGHADLKLYQNTNYIRNDHAAPLTNAMLSAADDGDDDIKYLVTGGNIVFESAFEVFISSGTYAPGGTVTGGAFDINGTFDANGNNVTVSGNWDATGGVYTSGANTTTFNGTTTLISGGTDANHDFNHVTLSGDVTLSTNAIDINGNILINATRTLNAAGQNINVSGNWTNSGTFTPAGSALTFDGVSDVDSGGTIAGKRFDSVLVTGTATLVNSDWNLTTDLYISGTLSNTNNLNITVSRHWQNVGTFVSGTGTVTFDGSGLIDAGGTGIGVNDTTKDFHNLVVTATGVMFLANTEIEIDGNLQIDGTFALAGYALDLNGVLVNNGTLGALGTEAMEVGTMDTDSGMVGYYGTISTTLPSAISTYYILGIDENGTSDPVFTLPAQDTVATFVYVTDGTLNFSGANYLGAAGITVAATGVLMNNGTGDLWLAGDVSNAGTITFDSAGGGAGDADSIQIRSTVAATQRNWQGAGTFTMIDVDAQDQTAIGGTPAFINVSSGTDAGNNVNWTFAADAGLTLSGVAYTGKAEAGTLNSKPIRVAHYNGVTRSYYTVTTNGAGAFSLSNALLAAGDVLIFYLNDVAEEGLLIYVSDGAGHADLKLYQNTNYIRNDNAAALTNAMLSAADDGDDDIKYLVTGGNIVFESAFEVFISSGTYAPGGNVTGGAFDINGTFDANGNNVTVSGNWDATGGVYTSGANTTTFNGTTTLISGGTDANHDFNNVTLSGDVALLTNDIDVNGSLLINATRTLDTSSLTIYLAGQWTNSGTFMAGAGTVVFDGPGANINSGGTTPAKRFHNVNVTGFATIVMNAVYLTGDMTISGTLENDIDEMNITVVGDWNNSGNYVSGTEMVYFDGSGTIDAGGTGVAVDDITFDFGNVAILSGTRTLASSELEVDDLLTISAGATLQLAGQNLDLNGTLMNSGTIDLLGTESVEIGVMDSDSGLVKYTGTASTVIPSAFTSYYNVEFDESGALDPVYTLPAVNVAVNGVLTVADGTLNYSAANSLTVSGVTTVAATGALTNTGTGDLTLGSTVANAGTITFDSSGAGAGDADTIQIRSSVGGTQRNWQGAGTFTMIDVNAQDQTAIGGTPAFISVSSGTDSGNNVNWTFAADAGLTLSGVAYTSKAEAATLNSKAIRVVHYNGTTRSYYTLTTNGAGAFSLTNALLNDGDILIFYLNDVAEEGLLIYKSDAAGHGDLKLYQNTNYIRNDSATSLTNAMLSAADDGDDDIKYLVTGANNVFETPFEVFIGSGTYAPGGTVTGGAFDINGTFNTAGNDVSASGDWVNTGNFISGNSLVTFTGVGAISGGGSGIGIDDTGADFSSLAIASGVRTLTGSELEVDGTLTIDAGTTLVLAGQNLDLNGTLVNNGTVDLLGSEAVEVGVMDTDSGLVKFTGIASTTIPTAFSTYYNVEFDESGALDPVWTLPATDVAVNGALTITDGTLAYSAANNLQVAGAFTIGNNGSLTNAGVGDLTLGSNVSNAGTISFDSSGGGAGDADSIQIRSTVGGTQRNWQGAGTFTMVDVNAQDQTAIGGTPTFINVSSGTDAGNNVNWVFGADAGLTLSGTAYTSKAEAGTLNSKNITVVHYNGATQSHYNLTTDGSGAFSVTGAALADGDLLVFYLNDEAEEGDLVYVSDAAGHADLKLYQDTVILRNDSATPLTNALLDAADDGDDDIKYVISSGNIAVQGTFELYLSSGTFAPGGGINAGSIDIKGTLDASGNYVTASGDWDATSGVYISGANTTTFTGIAAVTLISGGVDAGHDFNNLTINTNTTLSTNNIVVNGNLLINATRTLDASGLNINVSGNWANAGSFIAGAGTVTFDGSGTLNGGGTGVAVDDTTADFNNLVIASGTRTLSGTELEVDGILTISAATALVLAGQNLDLNGTLANDGTLDLLGTESVDIGVMDSDSGLVKYTGTASTTIPAAFATYYNLEFDELGAFDPVWTLSAVDVSVNGTLTVTDATLNYSAANNLQVIEAIVIAADGSLINSGTGDLTLGGDVSNAGTISFDSSGGGPGDADGIQIRSTGVGVKRNWQGAGTFSMIDVDAQDQRAIGGTPAFINVSSGTDAGNNVNWVFGADAGLTLSGVAYTGKDEAGTLNNKAITVVHYNGVTRSHYNLTTDGSGAFLLTGAALADGDVLVFYINDEVEQGNLVYVSDAAGHADLKLYQDTNYLRNDSATPLTNVLLDAADDGDDDIKYSVTGSNVTFDIGFEVYIGSGEYAPGGDIIGDSFDINGTLNAAGNNLIVLGNWDATGGVYTSGANTTSFLQFLGTSTLISGGTDANHDFNNITFGGDVTLSTNAIDINGNLLINATRTLDAAGFDINVAGNWTNAGSFISGAGTVTFDGSGTLNGGGTGVAVDDTTADFNNLVIASGTRTLSGTELEVDGTLTISAATTFLLAGQNLDLNGTLVNDGTLDLLGTESVDIGVLDTDSGLVKFTGTASTTIPAAFATYYNIEFDESGALDPVWTLPAVNIAVNGTLNVTDGTLNYSAANSLTVAGVTTVAATGALTNTGAGDLTLGATVANAGTISFDSSGGGAGDADTIQIRSTVPGTQRNWQGSGTFTMFDVDAQDQTAIGGTPALINVSSGTDAGNNVNWVFGADAGLTLSGTAYTSKAESATLNSKNINVVHYNGATQSHYNLTTDGSGAFSVTGAALADGDVLVFYLNDEAEEGDLVYVSDAAGHADLKLYQNTNYIRVDSATPLTNALLAAADDGDDDIKYLVSGADVTFESLFEVYIGSGQYAPGGAVSGGAYDINGTFNVLGNDVTVSGNWDATGGVYLTVGNTTTFNGTTILISGGANPSHEFDVMVIDGDVTLSTNDLQVHDSLVISATGSLDAAGIGIGCLGSWTNNGTFISGANTVAFSGIGTIDAGGTGIAIDDAGNDFHDVLIMSGNVSLSGSELEVDGTLTIFATRKLELSGESLDLNGTLVNSGTLVLFGTEAVEVGVMDSDSGLIKYIGTSSTTIPDAFAEYYNVEFDEFGSSDPVYTLPATNIAVNGDLNVTDGTLAFSAANKLQVAGALTIGVNGSLTNAGGGDLTLGGNVSNAGTVSFDSSGGGFGDADAIQIRSTANGTQRNWQGAGTFTMLDVDAQDQTAIGGNPSFINVASGTDAGNNINWVFGADAGLTLSGVAYTGKAEAGTLNNKAIAVVHYNGATQSHYYLTTDGSGAFSLTGAALADGDVLVFYLDDEVEEGVLVYVSNAAGHADLKLYQNTNYVRNDSAIPLTNTLLDAADDGDDDIKYLVTGANIVFESAFEVFVGNGTYAPGGTVTGGAFDINGTLDASGNGVTVSGNWDATGGIYISGANITDFNGTTMLITGGVDANHDFHHLEINGAVTLATNAVDINGDLLINATQTLDANGQDIYLAGRWTNSGTFVSDVGTVTLDGVSQLMDAKGTGIAIDDVGKDFHNLVVNSDTTLWSELEVDGTLSVVGSLILAVERLDLNGVLDNTGSVMSQGTAPIEIGTMDTDSGIFWYYGVSAITLPVGIPTYYNLLIVKANSTQLPDVDMTVNGDFASSTGTVIFDNDKSLTVHGSVQNDGVINNTGSGDLTLGGDVTNTGTISFDSAGGGAGDVDSIQIRSTIPGTQRNWQGAGTFTMVDVDASDQTAIGGSPAFINVSSGTDSGNNINWVFGADTGLTLSGTAYTGKAEAGTLNNKNINVVHYNGATQSHYNLITDGSGAFSLTGAALADGDVLVFYLNDEAEEGLLSYVADAAGHADLKLYQNTNYLRNDSATPLTNALLDAADDGDDDIKYLATGANIVFEAPFEIYVGAGTYTPGGTVTGGAFDINGTFNAGGNDVTVSGDWDATGGIYTSGANATTFNGTTTLISGGVDGDHDFNDVTLSGDVTLLTNAIDVNGNLLINATRTLDASGLNINVAGNWTNAGSFISGAGTVTFDGSGTLNGGGTGVAVDDTSVDFNNLVISSGARTLSGTELEVDGTLTISAATSLLLAGQNLDLNGTLDNSGTLDLLGTESVDVGVMDTDSGLVKYTGTTSTVIPATFTSYYNLTFDESGISDPVFTLPAQDIYVAQTLNINDADVAYSPANNLSVNAFLSISAGSSLINLGSGDLTLNLAVNNEGTITFDAHGGGAGDADDIRIRSAFVGSQHLWSGAGTFNMIDVDVQDQAVISSPPGFINVSSGTDSGNNINWFMAADVGITLSGTTYTGKAEAATLNNKAIGVVHYNGATKSYYNITTDGAGVFTLSNALLADGDVLVFFLNDEAEEGDLIYVSDAAGHADLKLYQNTNYIRNDSATPLTNALLAAADGGDNDIKYAVTGADIVFETAFELFVGSGSYAPGGTVTGGAFDINGTFDAAGHDVTVNGNWDATGGVYISGLNTTTFNGPALITSGGVDNSHDFHHLTVNSGNVQPPPVGTLDVDGNLLIAGGATFTLPSSTTYVAGNWTNLGTLTAGAGADLHFDGVTNLNAGGILVAKRFRDVYIDGSVTVVSTDLMLRGDMIIGASGQLIDSGSHTIQLDGAWSNSGVFSAGTGTVVMTDLTFAGIDSGGGTVGVDDVNYDFYNLVISSGVGVNVSLFSGELEVDNSLTIGAGATLDVDTALSLNGSFSNDGTLNLISTATNPDVYVASPDTDSGLVSFNGTDATSFTLHATLNAFYDVEFLGSLAGQAPDYTLTDANTTVYGTLRIGDAVTVNADDDKNLSILDNGASGTALTIDSGGVFANNGSGDLTLGGAVSNSGSITVDAAGAGGGASDDILIRSSVDGVQRNWQGGGTYYFADVDVKDQTVLGGTPLDVSVFDGTNSGNNINWLFGSAAGHWFRVTAYDSKAEGAVLAGRDLKIIAYDGVGTTEYTGTTNVSGQVQVSNLEIDAGDTYLVFFDNEAETGNSVIVAAGGAISNAKLYADAVVLRGDGGNSLTNALLSAVDNSDADIKYEVTGSNVVVESAYEVIIPTGAVYAPGGTATLGSIEINGTFAASGNNVTVSGSWDNADGTYTPGSNTTFFTGVGNLVSGGTAVGKQFYDMQVSNGATATLLANELMVSHVITLSGQLDDTTSLDIYTYYWNMQATGSFISGLSTVYIGPSTGFISGGGTGLGIDDSLKDFYNLVINGNSSSTTEVEVDGTLSVNSGMQLWVVGSLDINGILSNDGIIILDGTELLEFGTLDTDSGLFQYITTGAVTISSALSSYYDIMLAGIGSVTLPDVDVHVFGGMQVGTSVAFDNDKSLVVDGPLLISNSRTFTNTGTGDLTLGSDVTNNGTITFDSSDNAGNGIAISSTVPGTRRNWQGTGTFNFTDVAVSDQSAVGGTPVSIMATSSTDLGNNLNWFFDGTTSISGYAYADEAETTPLAAKALWAVVENSGIQTYYTATTAGDGGFSLANIDLSAGDRLLVFVDDETETGSLVYVSDGANVTDLRLYQNTVLLRNDNGAEVSNTDLAALAYGDIDTLFTEAAGDVVFDSSSTLLIPSGLGYRPGGDVTLGSVDIRGSFLSEGNGVDVSGNWNNTTGVYDAAGSTVTFSGTAQTITVTGTGSAADDATRDFDTVVVDSADLVVVGELEVDTALTINPGTLLDVSGATFDINGSYSNDGTLVLTGAEDIEVAAFDVDSGLTRFEPVASLTMPSVISVYYDVTLSASSSAVVATLPDIDVDINGALSLTVGACAFDDDKNLTVDGGITLATGTSFINSGTGDLALGAGVNNSGTIVFDAAGSADSILISSTAAGAQRDWIGSGVFNFTDVEVVDQSANGPVPAWIGVNFGTDSGNNTNWIFALDLTGIVTLDGNPLSGVSVSAGVLGTATTDSSGTYVFNDVVFGTSYTLTPTKPGHIFTPTSRSGVLNGYGSHDFAATLLKYTLSGTVTENGSPLAGVVVNAGAIGSRTTNTAGQFSFANVIYGTSYTLTPSKENYAFTPATRTGMVTGDTALTFTGKLIGFDISGRIILENFAQDPIPGVTVTAGGKTALTDADGYYTLPKVTVGETVVLASLEEYLLTPSEGVPVTVASGPISGVDFSARPKLTNPAYAMWNGFLGMINVLEVMNVGTEPLNVSLTVFTIGGDASEITRYYTVPAMTQRDIILNDLPGFETDTYGMVRVAASHDYFDGRVALYHPEVTTTSQYGFAYSEPLRNPSFGNSGVMFNSYHPGANLLDLDNTVYNWLTIANLDEHQTKNFTVKRYNMTGELVSNTRVSVPPKGRRDVDGGHINPGPNNVGTNIIIPDDPSALYLANLVRFAEGSNGNSFDYSFTLPASRGASRAIYAPISTDDDGENYVEVTNMLDESLDITLRFMDNEGFLIAENTQRFPAYNQRHYPVVGLLKEAVNGYVAITPSKPDSLLGQSVFYHRDITNRSIETAYASTAREPFGRKVYTTYNLYLGMKNLLRVMNLSEEEAEVTYTLRGDSSGRDILDDTLRIDAGGSTSWQLGLTGAGAGIKDSYGLLELETSRIGSLAAELVRSRQQSNGRYEFAIDTFAR